MALCALLTTLSGALLIYLSHPQQRLLHIPAPRLGQAAGSGLLLMGIFAWCKALGVGAGVASALTTVMFAWALLPYIAWWSGRHAVVAKERKE